MNPMEIVDQFDNISIRFNNLMNRGNKNNFKTLTSKDIELVQNQLMNFFNDLVLNPKNIPIIIKSNLDLKIWNLLTDRVFRILKIKIEKEQLGKNPQLVLQNLYSILMEDLKNSFELFRNVYAMICDLNLDGLNILISNMLNFMGDIKKLKLLLNRHFSQFKDDINIEGDYRKDANDALRFFQYALNNNPCNTRIYSNIGFVHREFLNDPIHSAYWFIRGLSCVDNDMKKLKDNIEKDFHVIRKEFIKKEYEVTTTPSMLKNDLEYLPILFYRIQGILYMNIDIDNLENLQKDLLLIIQKVLNLYANIPDNIKFNYEINGTIEQMTLLTIFNFHYNLNNLCDYNNNSERIVIPDSTKILNFNIYNHKILEALGENIKGSFKYSLNLIRDLIKKLCENMNEFNIPFVEKFILIFFYWFSLNYDVYNIIIDEEIKKYLKFLNYVLQRDIPEFNNYYIDLINQKITPLENYFIYFIPMNRFFILSGKSESVKIDDIKEINYINRICLVHFLNLLNLKAQNDEELSRKFFYSNISIRETIVTEFNNNNILKEKLILGNKILSLNVKKVKPLILLDACNIAMRHGDKTFSTKGIQIVMDYFQKNGHKVLAFLPEYLFNNSSKKERRVVPDNIDYLKNLYNQELIVQTPAQDYDDSYCIQFCKERDAYIVTNDLYRDYLEKKIDSKKRESERFWIEEKRISFTFHIDDFMPNPDCALFKQFSIDEYSKNKS